MEAYIYKAALLCGDCGREERRRLNERALAAYNGESHADDRDLANPDVPAALGFDPQDDQFDSDDYPAGPYANGGGEADSPNHCNKCGLFLENPLTSDGVAYVIGEWLDFLEGQGDPAVLGAWFDRYRYLFETEEEWIAATVKDRLEARFGKAYSVGYTATSELLRRFDTEAEASAYIATLPGFEDGRYYLDGPDTRTHNGRI